MWLDLLGLHGLSKAQVTGGRAGETTGTTKSVGHVCDGKELVEVVLEVGCGVDLRLGFSSAARDGVETLVRTASADASGARLAAIAARLSGTAEGAGALYGCGDGTLFVPVFRLGVVGSNGTKVGLPTAWAEGRGMVLGRHGCVGRE
jgi:hypothetical protein